jgi:hypothetical protein
MLFAFLGSSDTLIDMHIPQWLLYFFVTPLPELVYAPAITSTETFSKRAQINRTSNPANKDPRIPSFKAHVLHGLSKAQSYSHSSDPVLLHEVRNYVRGGPSISLPDFLAIDLDVIILDRGVPVLATLQGDLRWGRWRTSLVGFLPFDVKRLQEGITFSEIGTVMGEDGALLSLAEKRLVIPFDIIHLCRPIVMGIRTLVYVFNAPPQKTGESRRYLPIVAEGPNRGELITPQTNACLSLELENTNFNTTSLDASISAASRGGDFR